jgi:X-X-X-Leu-X-X-Gly heptad repeat protein
MKMVVAMPTLMVILSSVALTSASFATPISKVLDLLSGLETKISAEKAASITSFNEFSEWCEDQAKNFQYGIDTGKREVESLKATIEQETSLASSLSAKFDELSGSLAADNADVKAATEIRSKESKDFAADQAELTEVIDTLERAVSVLERELRKGGSALLQGQFSTVTQALGAIVDASVISAADASRLTALLQNSQGSADDSLELGAPAAAVYESHSNNIIDTLNDLLEKAQAQLSDARNGESSALRNFEMLKQGLEDQIKFSTKDAAEAKKSLALSGEKNAAAEGDLAMTSKELGADTTGLADLNQDCMTKAQEHEAADKSRAEELEALAAAKKAVAEMTSGASAGTYSLLQVDRSMLTSRTDLVNFEAVRFVRDLARKNGGDRALVQLASRMAAAIHVERAGEDPFAKVRGLIQGMIERLESDAGADSTHKAYCDKELSESNALKAEHDGAIEKFTTKINSLSAGSEQLKEQVAELSKGLAELAASRAEATKMRQEERAAFATTKVDLEQGIEGIKLALKVLREYYAKKDATAAAGASTSIIGLLEVCESDFTKGLAEAVSTEENAARTYDKEEKENEIERVTKEKDVEYKTKEAAKLDKAISDATTDRAQVQTELGAVEGTLKQLKDMCVAKPETYEARKAHREAEIAGLKEALNILENEAVALLQKHEQRRALRGRRSIRPHVA